MKYLNVVEGVFISRPNRFIAVVEIDGKEEVCHVKNTGRCKELLIKGVRVILEYCPSENRKTKYDLVAVYKNDRLINIDSQAPNKVAKEYLENYFSNSIIKPEKTYKNSRFDFYIEQQNRKIFLEVKGVTLEKDNIVYFPDAPTERGLKHIKELEECIKDGYEAYILFVVQMNDVLYFTPNKVTHKAFSDELKIAESKGVNIIAIDCIVKPDKLIYNNEVKVVLYE